MSIEEAIMGGIVLKVRKISQEEEKVEDESEKSDVYSWTAWFGCSEDESRYPEEES